MCKFPVTFSDAHRPIHSTRRTVFNQMSRLGEIERFLATMRVTQHLGRSDIDLVVQIPEERGTIN